MDGFNALIMTIAKHKSAELEASKTSSNNVDSIVYLMESWKSAQDAMGCSIKAANVCSDFEQFFD